MGNVRPKKHLGQHFLKDLNIAHKIVNSLTSHNGYKFVLEVGPGMGVLTDFLTLNKEYETYLIDLDKESVDFLHKKYPALKEKVIFGDFLHMDFEEHLEKPFAVIGNFPYNISSQIFFKILDHVDDIPEIVGMLQKEVAVRIASPPGNKDYGILSVLLQAFYNIEYLFTVGPDVFDPPPKVQSGVIRLRRNGTDKLPCDFLMFKRIVKQGFHARRKTLRNALKSINLPDELINSELLGKRAEQLSVDDFVYITKMAEKQKIEGSKEQN